MPFFHLTGHCLMSGHFKHKKIIISVHCQPARPNGAMFIDVSKDFSIEGVFFSGLLVWF